MNNLIVYKTTNLINGKIYIGQDSKNNPNYLGSGTLIQKALQKYGRENFKKETLEICETQEQLNSNEEYYIELYNSTNPQIGYNLSKGGESGSSGYKFTEEQKNKIKNRKRGYNYSEKGIGNIQPILQFDLQNNFIKEWPCIKIASENIKHCDISRCLNGKQKQSGGFKWKYKNQPTPEFKPKYIPKRVLQIDPLTNQIIKILDYPYQIFKELKWDIQNYINGISISYGFKWIYEENYNKQ